MAYGLCYANGPRVTIDTLLTLAREAGLVAQVERLERLARFGTRYSGEDFDVLSSVAGHLERAGVDVTGARS